MKLILITKYCLYIYDLVHSLSQMLSMKKNGILRKLLIVDVMLCITLLASHCENFTGACQWHYDNLLKGSPSFVSGCLCTNPCDSRGPV